MRELPTASGTNRRSGFVLRQWPDRQLCDLSVSCRHLVSRLSVSSSWVHGNLNFPLLTIYNENYACSASEFARGANRDLRFGLCMCAEIEM